MTEKLIFISCGQQRKEEKDIGTSVKNIVDNTPGFKAYFAESVQDLDSLSVNVFDGLRRCSGFIVFFQERGLVKYGSKNKDCYRSSVWVNQELAILAYRKKFEGIQIPILAFKDHKVSIEGAMSSLIVNPKIIKDKKSILEEINEWLKKSNFPMNGIKNDEIFKKRWNQHSQNAKNVISALLEDGITNVKEDIIRKSLQERYGYYSSIDADNVIRNSKLEFIKTDIVKLIENIHSGDELSINPIWKWHVFREIAKNT